MIALYDNQVFNATITSSSENPYYDFDTALNDTRLTRKGKFLGIIEETITFDLTIATDMDYIYVSNTNFTSSATVTIQGNATDVWTSPSFSETLVELTNNGWIKAFNTTETYRYWRLKIEDSTNTDSELELAYVFLGPKLTLPNMDMNSVIPYTSNASVTKALSGQIYGDKRVRLKGGRITFPIFNDTKRKEVETMFDYVDIVVPFLILFWEDSLSVEPPLYCTLTSNLEISKNPQEGLSWSAGLEFEEVR